MIDPTKFLPDILKWEGSVPWLYRDILGYATIGIGFLVRDADEALELPLANLTEGRQATADEIRREFTRVMSCQRGMRADAYRPTRPPRLEMPAGAIQTRALARLETEFLPGVRKLLPGFDAFPGAAQAALVDIAWNCGLRGLEKFGHMLAAVDQRDWREAARHCHRATSREERNAWTAAKFNDAAASEPPPRVA
jgi:GH24 family phage-related lysozyme (muramidase)